MFICMPIIVYFLFTPTTVKAMKKKLPKWICAAKCSTRIIKCCASEKKGRKKKTITQNLLPKNHLLYDISEAIYSGNVLASSLSFNVKLFSGCHCFSAIKLFSQSKIRVTWNTYKYMRCAPGACLKTVFLQMDSGDSGIESCDITRWNFRLISYLLFQSHKEKLKFIRCRCTKKNLSWGICTLCK